MAEVMFFNERLRPLARDPNALIIYPHAQRTGGVTLRKRVLAHVYGENRVYNRHYNPDAKKLAKLTDRDIEGYRAWTDIDNFSALRIKRPCLWIAALRHPLYRAASLYFYVQRKEGHRDQALAQRTNIEEFYRQAAEGNPKYYRNTQCVRVCGVPNAKRAIETIRAHYLAVGFTGHLSELVAALGAAFGWPEIEMFGKSPDEERYADSITPAFRTMVLDQNCEDLALFEAIRTGLDQ